MFRVRSVNGREQDQVWVRSLHTKGGPRSGAKAQPGDRMLEQEEETRVDKVKTRTVWTGGAGLSLGQGPLDRWERRSQESWVEGSQGRSNGRILEEAGFRKWGRVGHFRNCCWSWKRTASLT